MLKKLSLVLNFLFRPRYAYSVLRQSPELDISLLVLVITAIVTTIDTWIGYDFSSGMLMMVLIIIGALVGTLLGVVLYAHLLGWIASLFKEGDDSNTIRLAIPYCFLPVILAKLITLTTDNNRIDLTIKIVGALWFYAIASILISEIKRISILQAVLTMLISTLILLIPSGIIYAVANR